MKRYLLGLFSICGVIFFTVLVLLLSGFSGKPVKEVEENTVLLTPSPMPSVTPIKNQKFFGVNIAGAEFETRAYYQSSGYKGYSYFQNIGLTLFRLPFKWERIQPVLEGEFSAEDIDQYVKMIDEAGKAGGMVIIEPHNYARFNGKPLTVNDTQKLANLWYRMVNILKDKENILGYELMNEPHDLAGGCETWKILAQTTINDIRKLDTTHYILVPGYNWQSANSWDKDSACLSELTDPEGKILFSAHQYFDKNLTGKDYKSTECSDANRGADLINPFLVWLKKNGKKGIMTEYGVPGSNICWLHVLDTFLKKLKNNPDIMGGTYWAAGEHWKDYELSVDPSSGDQLQREILERYTSYSF